MLRALLGGLLLLAASAAAQPLPAEVIDRDEPYGGDPRQLIDVAARPLDTLKPALLIVHGGSWEAGDKRSARPKTTYFLRQGFQVAAMNYRLYPQASPKAQAEDVAAAAVWLAKNADRYGIDPREIYLVGHGAGAQLVSLVGTDPSYLAPHGASPGDLGGIVALDSGAYDVPKAIGEHGEATIYGRTLRRVFGDDPAFWKEVSPAFLTTRAEELPAFFLAQTPARGDELSQANVFVNNLRKSGASAVLFSAAGRDEDSIDRFFGTEGDPTTEAVLAFMRRESEIEMRTASSAAGGPDDEIPWYFTYMAPETDEAGRRLLGTSITGIVTHDGKLFAGNAFDRETTEKRRGQVLRLDAANRNWQLDLQMPIGYAAASALAPVRFNRDFEGGPIEPAEYLFVGAGHEKELRGEGPGGVFIRTPSGNWTKQDVGTSSAPTGVTEVTAIGSWRDTVTGVDHVFVGASPAPMGIYRGAFNPARPGGIGFDSVPEFEPLEGESIVGFDACGGRFFAATDRRILRRIDGAAGTWEVLIDLTDLPSLRPYLEGLDVYWRRNDRISSFRCDRGQARPTLAFTSLNRAFRYSPGEDRPVSELNIAALIGAELGRDVHYARTLNPALVQQTDRGIEEWIGLEIYYEPSYLAGMPDFPFFQTGFGKDGFYLVRTVHRGKVSYRLEELAVPGIDPNVRPLSSITDFEPSPFDGDSAIYVGGFAPKFEDVSNTAWIARGEL